MIKRSIELAARARLAVPIAVALTVAAMVVNESTYQHTIRTLHHGIALTDARIEAARTLQMLTEMEAATHKLNGGDGAANRKRFDDAARALPLVQDNALALLASIDAEHRVEVEHLRSQIDAQVKRLHQRADAPPDSRQAVAASPEPRDRAERVALDVEFDRVLTQAAGFQRDARITLYDAFALNRFAVHGLLLFSLLAFYLFALLLRRSDQERSQENHRLEGLIGERTLELRDLAGHLVTVREDERARLARELHDEMGGLLTATKLELARLRRVPLLPEVAEQRVAGIEGRISECIMLKRRIIENLRPSSLDQLGLRVALELLCADTTTATGIPVHSELQDVRLDPDAELTLFRVVQEALTNMAKHARASQAWVRLEATPGWATVTVRDDGRGFQPRTVPAGRHGLLGMRVRVESHGGRLRIESAPGHGTTVIADFTS